MAITAEELVKRTLNVASLPSLYTKVDEAINNDANSQYIVDIISEDTAMTARLLKLVNSAMFNFPKKIDTVSQAIAIVGTQQLRALILASSVMTMFKDVPEDLINMEQFWRHSVACGCTARIIASMRREQNIEYFFLAGLLHDIGRLILFKEKPNEMNQAIEEARSQGCLLFERERELIGFDHARLGGVLLKEWKLPMQFVETTRYHHSPGASNDYAESVAVIHLADVITNGLQFGNSGEIFVPTLNEKAWVRLNLNDDIIEGVIFELDKQYKVAVDFILGSDVLNQQVA